MSLGWSFWILLVLGLIALITIIILVVLILTKTIDSRWWILVVILGVWTLISLGLTAKLYSESKQGYDVEAAERKALLELELERGLGAPFKIR